MTESEIDAAYDKVDKRLIEAIRHSARRIRAYHASRSKKTWLDFGDEGYALGQKITPLGSAAVYVPGGTAMYPSSVLMNVIPASVAGVKHSDAYPADEGRQRIPADAGIGARGGATEIYRGGRRRQSRRRYSAPNPSRAWTRSPAPATYSWPTPSARYTDM